MIEAPKITQDEDTHNLLEEELIKDPEQQALEEQVKHLHEELERSNIARSALECKLEQAHSRESDLGRALKQERKEHEREIRHYERELQKETTGQIQSIKWPCVCIAIFAVLSLLIGLCADRGWMVNLLAEILICLCLCVCTFFSGIVWSRTRK